MRYFQTCVRYIMKMSSTIPLPPNGIRIAQNILPENVGNILARGKVGERTVFEVPGGSFNRTFRDVYGTVLHDIKNLSKTRTVAWNDTKGKTGMEKLKQIFNNIKHNWHAWRYGKKKEAALMYKLGDSIKAFEDFVEKEKLDISDSHLRNEIKLLYGEVSEFTKGSSLREIRNEMKSVIFNAEEQSQSIGWDFRETFESFANEAFDVTSEDIKAVTDEFKATYPNADTEAFERLVNAYADKKNSMENPTFADRLQMVLEHCIDTFEKTAFDLD